VPTLIWTTHKLADGWVLLCVDANFEQPGEPEAMMGYRRAVHPFHFDESENPVMDFSAVIAEMKFAVEKGVEGQQLLSASRACGFERHHLQGTGE